MAKLVVTEQGKQRTLEIENTDVVEIGREDTCQIRIADPLSSRRHCRILGTLSGFELVDLGSSNGTVHNGMRIERVPLVAGDRIQIGEVRIEFIEEPRSEQPTAPLMAASDPPPETKSVPPEARPTPQRKNAAPAKEPARSVAEEPPLPAEPTSDDAPHLVIVDGPLEGRRVALSAPFVIGRKEGCDLVLPDRKSSGNHARIDRQGERWIVTDLESGNGLFVGKNRVKKHKLVDGDLLLIGDTHLRLRGIPTDGSLTPASSASQVFRAVDEGEFTEEDLSRLTPRLEEEARGSQWVQTIVVLVSAALIVYFGRSIFIDLTENRVSVSESNLLGLAGSFENPPEAGWGEAWAVDSTTSDSVTLAARTELGLPHGESALAVTSSGGDAGAVRLYATRAVDFTEGKAFRYSGQLRSDGFSRVGLAVRWFTRRGTDLVAIDEDYSELESRNGSWTQLHLTAVPPRYGDASVCRIGIIALGRGSVLVDDLSLEEIDAPESSMVSLQVRAGDDAMRVGVDPHGLLSVVHTRDEWLRSIRFATGDEVGGVAWGQLFPTDRTVLDTLENGSIRNRFDLGSNRVTQVTQVVGGVVRVSYTTDDPSDARLVLELGTRMPERTSSLFHGEETTRQGASWTELDGAVGDEWVIGRGAEQLILRLGVPGRIEVLGPVAARNGLAVSWTPITAPAGGVLDLSIGTVSDRERRRIDEVWQGITEALDARREGAALEDLESLEREFPWRDDVIARVAERRATILASAGAGWEQLRAILEDHRRFPDTPIAEILVERGREFIERFVGTEEAQRARNLVDETERQRAGRSGEAARERARTLLALGNEYFDQRRDPVARLYFEWVRDEHAGTEEARSAEARLRLIEARE